MADNVQLTKGCSTRSEENFSNEIVEVKRSEKRMRANSPDTPFDHYDHKSEKRDLKFSRSSDLRRSSISEVQEDPIQNKNGKFVRKLSDDGNEIFRRAKRKTPVVQRSLAIVLASLLGVQIVIELRNDSEITGTVEETDASMNVVLNDVRKVRYFAIFCVYSMTQLQQL
jgi:small nuclear ribonucleoprotein (snRNP)-like protein